MIISYELGERCALEKLCGRALKGAVYIHPSRNVASEFWELAQHPQVNELMTVAAYTVVCEFGELWPNATTFPSLGN